MSKIPTTRLLAIASFVVFLGLVSAGALLVRPDGTYLPGVPFFIGFFLFPCLISWLLVIAAARMRVALRTSILLIAIVAFYLLCHLQLKGLVSFALAQSNPQVEGVVSNFYVLAYLFFDRSVLIAGVYLLVFTFTWPLLARRLGPNNSFKPKPLRGSA